MRKISAHYYISNVGELLKFPIISIENGVIVSIVCHEKLPEIAGLEFYSGIILPRFVDAVSLESLNRVISPSVLSPLVAEIVALTSDTIEQPTLKISTRPIPIFKVDVKELDRAICNCGLSVVSKINKLVALGFFGNTLAGLTYFTSALSRRYLLSPREVSVGCKAEFLICSDMLFITGVNLNELKIRVLS